MNNPFIRYKIYSSSTDNFSSRFQIRENTKVLCLIETDEIEYQAFLQKILSAAKIKESDYQIISLDPKESISAAEHKWLEQVEHILCFGIPARRIDVNIPHRNYHSTIILSTKIYQVPGLSEIESDKNEKQQLWQLMKNEFLHG